MKSNLSPNPVVATEVTNGNVIMIDDVQVVEATPSTAVPLQGTVMSNSVQETPHMINEAGAREFLSANNWPPGLQDTFLRTLPKTPIRFFICDNSGSMAANDGHRTIGSSPQSTKLVTCSRWAELTQALRFHAELTHRSNMVSEFRLLNSAPPIRVDGTTDGYSTLMTLLEESPGGGTPLCRHIREVTAEIRRMEPSLRSRGQKACVIIATDGESSDGDIAAAMRPLQQLPVWVVVRLCTDENNIVEYWNNIDSELELDMDVLDDLSGEAAEVTSHNSWLTYGEPMHRLREFGIPIKEIDLLDESKLSTEQMKSLCSLILGGSARDYPMPDVDFHAFTDYIKQKLRHVGVVWDPVTQRVQPWIHVNNLSYQYGPKGCVVM